MRKQMFLYSTLIIFTGLLLFFAASVYVDYTNNLTIAKDTVTEITKIFASIYENTSDSSQFADIESDIRITVISAYGAVLSDSRPLDIDHLESHLNRPEIQSALNNSPEHYIRYSDSLGLNLIYYALKIETYDSYVFIRTSIPVAKIDSYLFRSLPLLVFLLLTVVILSFLFTRSTVNKMTAPFDSIGKKLRSLAEGEYKSEPTSDTYEEIDKITREIDDIASVLQKNFDDLSSGKNKLDYIINNIGDGLLALDRDNNISLINPAALKIFNAASDLTGNNLSYLSYDKTLHKAVEECIAFARDSLFELEINGIIYFVTVKRLSNTGLTMIILSDVTENRQNAKRREEFFANASHELKTPLTAIKGFNELASFHNKDESIQKYVDSISRETERMLHLIGDMLKLSELENTQDVNPAPIALSQVINETRESLSTYISEKSITFEAHGDASITSEPKHIYELVKNLIENAIRYNNHGGKVSVTVRSDLKATHLIISDNGIGIPPNEQSRIFERFYRVEKSRSQRNGGTGLGLSIVKHICVLYNWKLSLKSKPNIGTEIIITFTR